MLRSLRSALGVLIRVILASILIAGLFLAAFIAYKGSQPMQQVGANGMTYWQFMRDRISAIRELPAKCQEMYFTSYLIAMPKAARSSRTWYRTYSTSPTLLARSITAG